MSGSPDTQLDRFRGPSLCEPHRREIDDQARARRRGGFRREGRLEMRGGFRQPAAVAGDVGQAVRAELPGNRRQGPSVR